MSKRPVKSVGLPRRGSRRSFPEEFKREAARHRQDGTRNDRNPKLSGGREITEYLHYYGRLRKHSALGYITPAQFELLHRTIS
jgi:hypothetical protein